MSLLRSLGAEYIPLLNEYRINFCHLSQATACDGNYYQIPPEQPENNPPFRSTHLTIETQDHWATCELVPNGIISCFNRADPQS